MKLAPILILNVLVVGGALFVYDTLQEEPHAQVGGPIVHRETERIVEGPRGLEGQPEIDRVRAEVAELRRTVARLERAGSTDDPAGLPETEAGDDGEMVLPSFGLEDPGPEDNRRFDEETVRRLSAYMDEIQRRERHERMVEGIERQLDRLGVQITPEQTQSVVKATMDYRQSLRDHFRDRPRGDDQAARDEWQGGMETLREEFSNVVYRLVSTAEAEKIVQGVAQPWGARAFRAAGGRGRDGRGR